MYIYNNRILHYDAIKNLRIMYYDFNDKIFLSFPLGGQGSRRGDQGLGLRELSTLYPE